MNLQSFCAVCLIVLCVCATAMAYDGKFPGKGNRADWDRANQWFNRGNDSYRVNKLSSAIDYYKKAIRLYPYDADFYDGLAHCLDGQTGTRSAAEKLYLTGIRVEPSDAHVRISYAGLLLDQGKFDDAKHMIVEASKLILSPVEKRAITKALDTIKHHSEGKR